MEARPRLSSVSSYASSSSLSSYYGCTSGFSDVELTNDTSYGGGSKSRTLFDDVKVILCRHDRKLLKLEDDLMLMVRWLHDKFGFILKSESTSSIPSGWDENMVAEDGAVFSDDENIEDGDDEESTNTAISRNLDHVDDDNDTQGSQIQMSINNENDCDDEQEEDEVESSPEAISNHERRHDPHVPSQNKSSFTPNMGSFKGSTVSSTLNLQNVVAKANQSSVTPSNPTSSLEKMHRKSPRQPRSEGNKEPQLSQCDTCGKFLKDQCTLRQHKQIHLNVRPFTCPEPECGKSFRRKFHLQTHLLIHQGVRKHQCGYCGRLFLLQKDLISHERIHTGEKPFQCPECPKSFNLKSHLVMHLRIHTGEKPYKCDICSKHFSQSNSLRIHKKKVHSANKQPSTSTQSEPKQSKKKSSPKGNKKDKTKGKSKPSTSTVATVSSLPSLPAKLPLYRNQGKILNYLVKTVPTLPATATLTPAQTITILQQPTTSTTHQIEFLEPIIGNPEGEQIILPASTLNLMSGTGTSIITSAEILENSPQISFI